VYDGTTPLNPLFEQSVFGDNYGSGVEADETSPPTQSGGVWFTWTAPALPTTGVVAYVVQFDTIQQDISGVADTVIDVFRVPGGVSLPPVFADLVPVSSNRKCDPVVEGSCVVATIAQTPTTTTAQALYVRVSRAGPPATGNSYFQLRWSAGTIRTSTVPTSTMHVDALLQCVSLFAINPLLCVCMYVCVRCDNCFFLRHHTSQQR
jgi:hypothetical protein